VQIFTEHHKGNAAHFNGVLNIEVTVSFPHNSLKMGKGAIGECCSIETVLCSFKLTNVAKPFFGRGFHTPTG